MYVTQRRPLCLIWALKLFCEVWMRPCRMCVSDYLNGGGGWVSIRATLDLYDKAYLPHKIALYTVFKVSYFYVA